MRPLLSSSTGSSTLWTSNDRLSYLLNDSRGHRGDGSGTSNAAGFALDNDIQSLYFSKDTPTPEAKSNETTPKKTNVQPTTQQPTNTLSKNVPSQRFKQKQTTNRRKMKRVSLTIFELRAIPTRKRIASSSVLRRRRRFPKRLYV